MTVCRCAARFPSPVCARHRIQRRAWSHASCRRPDGARPDWPAAKTLVCHQRRGQVRTLSVLPSRTRHVGQLAGATRGCSRRLAKTLATRSRGALRRIAKERPHQVVASAAWPSRVVQEQRTQRLDRQLVASQRCPGEICGHSTPSSSPTTRSSRSPNCQRVRLTIESRRRSMRPPGAASWSTAICAGAPSLVPIVAKTSRSAAFRCRLSKASKNVSATMKEGSSGKPRGRTSDQRKARTLALAKQRQDRQARRYYLVVPIDRQ